MWANQDLWVSESSDVGVKVMLDSKEGSGKRQSSDQQHRQHDERECGRDVHCLYLGTKFFKSKNPALGFVLAPFLLLSPTFPVDLTPFQMQK